jgi:hypothetical protein
MMGLAYFGTAWSWETLFKSVNPPVIFSLKDPLHSIWMTRVTRSSLSLTIEP